ncbi:ribonuclease HII [Alphaproteobacteria bacterium HT1-32]|nr:ribonuclease HII [Alphaproteobacteria bacterium HT1-32]
MPDFTFERAAGHPVAGIDEAGRGPWAGPVVAAAVILGETDLPADMLALLDDSKKLTAKRRDLLFDRITGAALVGIGMADVTEIDELNILNATYLAMQRAAGNLPIAPASVLVDGNRLPELHCPAQAIVKGDSKCFSIAAASVIAKVFRDRLMSELAETYPGYGWERNAGYGTAQHQAALIEHGITPHHRKSFKPIAAIIT